MHCPRARGSICRCTHCVVSTPAKTTGTSQTMPAHRLGLAVCRADGPGWRTCRVGSSLSRPRCGLGAGGGARIGGGSDVSRFLIPAAIFLALAGVLYVGVVHSPNKSTMQSALLGKTVPDFTLPVLD